MAQEYGPDGERTEGLRGFDDEFEDIVGYILGITHRIWEEKGMGRILDHYAPDVTVHTPYGQTMGREQVLRDSIGVLAALPDRRLYAEDVIWAGNAADGFHTSHRIWTVAHNTGHSAYGPPTGRRVAFRTIANCFVRDNRIVEEWLARDGLSMVRQLGFNEREVARELAEKDAAEGASSAGETERVTGQKPPGAMPPKTTEGFDVEGFVRRSMHETWNQRLFNKVDDYHAENFACHTSTARELYGRGDYKAFLISTVAAFPDAKMNVEHVYWLGDDEGGYRVAARWRLAGTHDGPSRYGAPTGKHVDIMGISHYLVKGGRFVEEWTVLDELALLKQLYSPESEGVLTERG